MEAVLRSLLICRFRLGEQSESGLTEWDLDARPWP